VQLEATGATDYVWTPPAIFSNPFSPNPVFTATEDRWISVQGTIAGCTDTDSVYIDVTVPEIDAKAVGDTVLCLGKTVPLRAENNVGDQGISWSPAQGLTDPLAVHPVAKPSGTTTFYATLSLPGCTVTDSVTIVVDTLFMPNLLFSDTLVCQGAPVTLTDSLFTTGGSVYRWEPATDLSNGASSQPVARPEQAATYTLYAGSLKGACKDTARLRIDIIPADVEIGPAVRELCSGQTAILNATVNPGSAATVQWLPSFEVSAPTGASVSATPTESVTITAVYQVNGCTVYDSVRLKVDSLPYSMDIKLDPVKPVYCPGDTIILVSKTYEPASFPDIMHEWLPGPGQQETPADLWNMIVTATKSDTFQRITVSGGCRDTSEVFVKVGVIPEIMVTAAPPKICAGTQVQITATVKPEGEKLKWQDNPALSCTECANPTARPTTTTMFTVTTPEADCPGSASVTVEVLPPAIIDLVPEIQICLGDSVRLNRAPAEPGVTYIWMANPPGGLLPNTSSITVSPTQRTGYVLIAEGPQKCVSTQVSAVTPLQATINAGPDLKGCAGVPLTLNATVTGAVGTVVWSPGQLPGPSVTITPRQTSVYTATLLYGPGNTCRATDQVNVEVSPEILLGATSTPSTTTRLCAGTPVKIRLTNASPAGIPIIWEQNGTRLTPTGDSISVIPSVSEGRAGFVVRTANTFNCPDKTVEFNYNVERCFDIPNVFTPDGDQVNDTFGPLFFGGTAEVVRFEIYNRWGNRVFSGNQSNQRWNGTIDGTPAPTDVYIYRLVVRYADGKEDPSEGEVTLLR
jgi:gliding motility-associated-like protein